MKRSWGSSIEDFMSIAMAIMGGMFSFWFKTPLKEFPVFAVACHYSGFQGIDRAFQEIDRQGLKRNWVNVRGFLDQIVVTKAEKAAGLYSQTGEWPSTKEQPGNSE
jgi:hypothetical protein